MVSVLESTEVDRGFDPWLGQSKDYQFGIDCFSVKHTALMRKKRFGIRTMCQSGTTCLTEDCFFNTIKIKVSVLV